MTREADVISHALMLLEQTVAFTTNGTADKPRRVRKIDLACEHISDWMERQLPKDGQRGGQLVPMEQDDRVEVQALGRRVRADREALNEAVRVLNHTARVIYDVMLRNVETLDPAKLPTPDIPGCVSCAKAGHFAPVMPAADEKIERSTVRGNFKAHDAGLCRWCWDAQQATGKLPEVDECDVYHREGPRAAGLLRAKREKRSA